MPERYIAVTVYVFKKGFINAYYANSHTNFSGGLNIFKTNNKPSKKADGNSSSPYTRDISIYYIPEFLLKKSRESDKECELTPEAKAEKEKRITLNDKANYINFI